LRLRCAVEENALPLAVKPAFERVKKSKLQNVGTLRSVIPAKAGIHLSSWNKL
jgi:hypothetical protein